jgi:O-antigen/teichoic acid export membrane protein
MGLAKRSVTAVAWNIPANLITVALLLVRGILLSRLLPFETFGTYAFASGVVVLTALLADFGLGSALLHRAPETEDEGRAAAVHFTLKLLFTAIWLALLLPAALLFAEGELRLALLAIAGATGMGQLLSTPNMLLVRRVVHRRLALGQLLDGLLTTVVAVSLAYRGSGLWSLLAVDWVAIGVRYVIFYLWRPVWRPRLLWAPDVARYMVRFGSRSMAGEFLVRAIDRTDDLWVGAYLGSGPLGIYSRAFTFAAYPRRLLAASVDAVAGGTFAELKGNRQTLSRAFFSASAFLIRSGFLLVGALNLIAPELIVGLLTERWLPMVVPFRLMLVFALIDPLRNVTASLFTAVGEPERIVWTRAAQLAVLVAGLFAFGLPWGVNGAALAINVMLLAGTGLFLWQARRYVDFSLLRLFGAPLLSLLAGFAAALAAERVLAAPGFWLPALVRLVAYSAAYGLALLALEREALLATGARLLLTLVGAERLPVRVRPVLQRWAGAGDAGAQSRDAAPN